MAFPGLLSATAERRPGSRRKGSSRSGFAASTNESRVHEFISDEKQLASTEPESADIRELNNCLEALATVFPDIQIDVFREMLAHFSGESRLAVCADVLLQTRGRDAWIKDRRKTPETRDAEASARNGPVVPRAEAFRSPAYKNAVKNLAWDEFKGLSTSAINAVLAESNYSYLAARPTLVRLSSESWRYAISSLFYRRKPVTTGEAKTHPLVSWKSSGRGAIIPTIKSTGNAELDRELFDELIRPLNEAATAAQVTEDRVLAARLNDEEADAANATHECVCCFSTGTFEEFTACNTDGHLICFLCVQRSVKEAVWGQGWRSTIDANTGRLRCLAVDGDGCKGLVLADHLHRAVMEMKTGAEILHRLELRLVEHSLLGSNMPLARCPFCEYAEVDDVYLPPSEAQLKFKTDDPLSLFAFIFYVAFFPFAYMAAVLFSFVCQLLSETDRANNAIKHEWAQAIHRHRKRRRGPKFTCKSPSCGRASCLSCSKSWTDVHICHESSLLALRTQVEQAMSMAIKRVCPRCNLSFVKADGCNKLVCNCGYKMCYVCRKGLDGLDDPYRHFCQHLRVPPGTECTQCDKCSLFAVEDAERVRQQAKAEVERKWRTTERRELSSAEKDFLETGSMKYKSEATVMLERRRLPSVAEALDAILDSLFV